MTSGTTFLFLGEGVLSAELLSSLLSAEVELDSLSLEKDSFRFISPKTSSSNKLSKCLTLSIGISISPCCCPILSAACQQSVRNNLCHIVVYHTFTSSCCCAKKSTELSIIEAFCCSEGVSQFSAYKLLITSSTYCKWVVNILLFAKMPSRPCGNSSLIA